MKLLYIDLFCGAGGTSTGIESATLNGQKCAHVIACLVTRGVLLYREMGKPKLFHRVFMRYLLGWYWVDSDK